MDRTRIESNLGEFRRNITQIQTTGIGQLFGDAHYPSFLGRSLAMMVGATGDDDETLTKYLSQFPTETTLGERKFLFNFFLNFWDGRQNVLEVGPFLGGTSRAIAMGMLHNQNREENKKLYTYDKFRDYYQPEHLLAVLAPLFKAGVLDDAVGQAITKGNSFKEVYESLHANQSYSELVVAQTGVLPDFGGQEIDPEDVFVLPDDRNYSAVFVDGAKSWFGTKRFMTLALQQTSSESYYLFQDYGAHTCFWIPVFLEVMKDHFKLVAHVDHTYVYQQVDEVSALAVDQAFPDSPLEFTLADYRGIFRNLLKQAHENSNTYTLLNYQLQHAAAMSYLGYLDEARDKIVDLLKTPNALTHKDWILNALNTPTYTPEGNISLF